MPQYLKLPLIFAPVFSGVKLAECSLKESVERNLHLLITSSPGENKQDLRYGSQFWEHDYDVHLSNDSRREAILTTLRQQIQKYEPRLKAVSLKVEVRQAEYKGESGLQLRRRIEIIINATLVHSDEPFRFQTGFFIGPLSFD